MENTFSHVVRSNAVVDGGRQKGKENAGYIFLFVFEVRPLLFAYRIFGACQPTTVIPYA